MNRFKRSHTKSFNMIKGYKEMGRMQSIYVKPINQGMEGHYEISYFDDFDNTNIHFLNANASLFWY